MVYLFFCFFAQRIYGFMYECIKFGYLFTSWKVVFSRRDAAAIKLFLFRFFWISFIKTYDASSITSYKRDGMDGSGQIQPYFYFSSLHILIRASLSVPIIDYIVNISHSMIYFGTERSPFSYRPPTDLQDATTPQECAAAVSAYSFVSNGLANDITQVSGGLGVTLCASLRYSDTKISNYLEVSSRYLVYLLPSTRVKP